MCKGDRRGVGLLKNCAKIFLKRLKTVKDSVENWTILKGLFAVVADCILNCNMDRLHHMKDVTLLVAVPSLV